MVEIRRTFSDLIRRKEWRQLKKALNDLDVVQIAGLIEESPDEEDVILMRLLSRELSKEVFQLLPFSKQEQIIAGMAQYGQRLANLLNDLEPDDRTALFEELPAKITHALMDLLTPGERDIAIRLLGYPEESIGRLMTTEYVAVKPTDTIEQAFAHIRKYGKDSETLDVIYVVDDNWKLIDDLKIKAILLASPEQRIDELLDQRFVALNAFDDQEAAIRTFQDYDRVALPVVNDDGTLLGIITVDDIMDVVEEESTEDFQKFGSFQRAITDPLRARVLSLYKNRLFWLLALVFMNVFSGAAISNFEHVIQSAVSLVFFLPLLIDSGGNAGAQSATLMIRSLAVGEVRVSDWYKMIFKEIVVSLLLGATLAVGVALIAHFRAPEIVMVVSLTMVLIVITGSLIGMLLPFAFTRLNLDPATASAPLITSIADICGVIIYFSIAKWFFGF
ncbi:MAG: magnesium transporter [Pseudomonadota bacterium]|nr:magnesium transporter [Pseudomonadota bacterium]